MDKNIVQLSELRESVPYLRGKGTQYSLGLDNAKKERIDISKATMPEIYLSNHYSGEIREAVSLIEILDKLIPELKVNPIEKDEPMTFTPRYNQPVYLEKIGDYLYEITITGDSSLDDKIYHIQHNDHWNFGLAEKPHLRLVGKKM